jgi:hypothetical protein
MICRPAVLLLLLSFSVPARADDRDGNDGAAAPPPRTAASAGAGSFLAFSHPAALDTQGAYATGTAGYDGARGSALYEASAEVRLWGPLSLRGGALYAQGEHRLRPSFGARVQVLHEARNGLDAAAGLFYRPEGLTEAEGELEAVVSAGAHLGSAYLLGNLVYGQDPDGNERDGEVRLAALAPVGGPVLVGLDSRLRFALGTRSAKKEPTLDALVGPSATVLVGPVALLLHAGGSAFRLDAHTAYGLFVLGGLGTAF